MVICIGKIKDLYLTVWYFIKYNIIGIYLIITGKYICVECDKILTLDECETHYCKEIRFQDELADMIREIRYRRYYNYYE